MTTDLASIQPEIANTSIDIRPGTPYPLGATWDGLGTNFAIFSENATAVELCLFDSPQAKTERSRILLPEQTDYVWHVYLPHVKPGQLYGFRVHGPYAPEQGHRFNPNKLLLDPYAKASTGPVTWDSTQFGYNLEAGDDMVLDERDSAPGMPRSIVIDPNFDWEGDRKPNTPIYKSIIYELHVKGFTQLHPDIDEHLRGTYTGLAQQSVIDYLKSLGVTAVELLPVHEFIDDQILLDKGLTNYWGYNTIGYFAPESSYASTDTNRAAHVYEFKELVKAMHRNGIEVILDVVYNHTAEGNHFGPTLSFKGVDNAAYYRLVGDDLRYYMDYTGTGNSLNMLHPRTLQMVMDSLRYWVTEMHVDGFRFDLASTLARGLHEVNKLSSFLDIIHQDPIISQVKLIAEPWDVGEGGYQVGNFPVGWAEWNGKYRDSVRRFWKGDTSALAELGYRLTGSSDLYQHNGRAPYASINFITSHDGFTLNDLVSYNDKHNDANGEGNNDGDNNNNSWNCGAEGPTDDPDIIELRERQKRNFLATLLFSQGVPMICGGDEAGRTQQGNNNAYCQDNEISWFKWQGEPKDFALLDFTRRLIKIRQDHPVLHRRKFFQGQSIHGEGTFDILWLQAGGDEMDEEMWNDGEVDSVGLLLNGGAMNEWDEFGSHVKDDILLLLINAHWDDVPFVLPGDANSSKWQVLVDTNLPGSEDERSAFAGETFDLKARSLVLLCQDAPGKK